MAPDDAEGLVAQGDLTLGDVARRKQAVAHAGAVGDARVADEGGGVNARAGAGQAGLDLGPVVRPVFLLAEALLDRAQIGERLLVAGHQLEPFLKQGLGFLVLAEVVGGSTGTEISLAVEVFGPLVVPTNERSQCVRFCLVQSFQKKVDVGAIAKEVPGQVGVGSSDKVLLCEPEALGIMCVGQGKPLLGERGVALVFT
ncbi:hypothetical protein VTK26DRAFT_3668 [Humicola hyalothermophila]